MSSFVFRGQLWRLFEKHGADIPQVAQDVVMSLCEVGFFHTLDEFGCFKAFESSTVEFCVHRRFSSEHHCSACGVIQAGLEFDKCRQVGCGGILAPTISRDPPEGWGAQKPLLDLQVDDLISTCTSRSTCA